MTSTTAELDVAGRGRTATLNLWRWSGWLRRGTVMAVLGLAVVAATGRSREVAEAGHHLAHPHWGWLVVALSLESASMIVFARVQQGLLRAAEVHVGLGAMTAITLAGDALARTLPGGVAWGAPWVFRRLRQRGADRLVAGWVVLVAGALGSFALFVVLAAGIEIAGQRGPVAHLRLSAAALAALPVLAVGAILVGRRSARARTLGQAAADALVTHCSPARRLRDAGVGLARRIAVVRLGARGWAATGVLALCNWLADCACLLACVWAVGGTVPWRGLLVAYALAQVAAAVPLVPGGLGVVEGGLSFFLIAYGMPADSAVAAVLLYRLISFWAVVPMGWGVWSCFTVMEHRLGRARNETPTLLGGLHRPSPALPPRLEPAA